MPNPHLFCTKPARSTSFILHALTAHPIGLAPHGRQRAGQGRVCVVRIAPRDPVSEVILFAGAVLLGHDLAQIAGLGLHGLRRQPVQMARLPVRQDQPYREARDQAAGQRVEQARHDQAIAVADLIKREQPAR